jgi:hypothetical protein
MQVHTWSEGEIFLKSNLQKKVIFSINNKVIKKGKMLLYRKNHFYVQITVLNEKQSKENFEIPFPFGVEIHETEGLMYLDYRISSLNLTLPLLNPNKVSSSYYNKILELQVQD